MRALVHDHEREHRAERERDPRERRRAADAVPQRDGIAELPTPARRDARERASAHAAGAAPTAPAPTATSAPAESAIVERRNALSRSATPSSSLRSSLAAAPKARRASVAVPAALAVTQGVRASTRGDAITIAAGNHTTPTSATPSRQDLFRSRTIPPSDATRPSPITAAMDAISAPPAAVARASVADSINVAATTPLPNTAHASVAARARDAIHAHANANAQSPRSTRPECAVARADTSTTYPITANDAAVTWRPRTRFHALDSAFRAIAGKKTAISRRGQARDSGVRYGGSR